MQSEREICMESQIKKENKDSLIELQEKTFNQAIQSNKTLAIASGSVASLSALVAVGNFIVGNELIGLQNTGTAIALTSCTVGNIKLMKQYQKEKSQLHEEKILDSTDLLKKRINNLKDIIEKNKIRTNMNQVTGLGFLISTISATILSLEPSYSKIALALLSGIASILNFSLAVYTKKDTKQHQEELTILEQEKTNLKLLK